MDMILSSVTDSHPVKGAESNPGKINAEKAQIGGSCLAAATLGEETVRTDRTTVWDSGERISCRLHSIDENI